MDSWWTILTLSFSLFILMDPIGNVPFFISLLKDYSPEKQRKIIAREMCVALATIILFSFVGDGILKVLNVKTYTTMIAGGIILFLISIKMIFPVKKDPEVDPIEKKEPFIVPLAIPLVAGPAVLVAVMLYSRDHAVYLTIPAIFLAWVVSVIILLASSYLKKVLGWRGLTACERLMGLILTLISVEMFLEGLSLYIAAH